MLNFDGGVGAVKFILKFQMSSRSFQGDTSVVVQTFCVLESNFCAV